MRKWNSEKRAKTQGFSLVELMVVAAIALIIAAVAVPNVIRGMRHLRLRSTASSLVGLLQQARQQAVRDNRNYQVLFDQDAQRTNNLPVLYLDTDYSATYTRGEPMFPLPTDVTTAGASPLNNNQLEGAMSPNANGQEKLVISISRATAPTFNPRGRACEPTIPGANQPITVCNTLNGAQQIAYGIYLQSTTLPVDGWAAVSVSPAGRIKRWRYDSSNGTWQ